MQQLKCFDIFLSCVKAIHNGKLITPVGIKDKEFHFQNWRQLRIEETGKTIDNPHAGRKHVFAAYRHCSQADKPVTLR